MGMGGGAGAQAPSLEERARFFMQANPGASRSQIYDMARSGLSPMQYENYSIGQKMVRGDGKNDPGAMADVRRYGMQMSNLAQGGLLARGMGQLNQALNTPAMAPGLQARMGARMGVAMTPEQQAAMEQQAALQQASTRVGLTNQTRQGLVNAQRDMRFGGINV